MRRSFERWGSWKLSEDKTEIELWKNKNRDFGLKGLIYAFAVDKKIKYIGETGRSLLTRLKEYKNADRDRQSDNTNERIHGEIWQALIKPADEVVIEVLTNKDGSPYQEDDDERGDEEDDLRDEYKPPWNEE